MSRVTIADVATAAGVSKTAVSFAFNNPEKLGQATLERVLGVAQELGYTPHPAARALSMRRSGTIGVLIPQRLSTVFANPFTSELIQGLGELCEEHELTMLLVPPLDGSLEGAIRQASVDGFISLGLSPDDQALEMLDRVMLPPIEAAFHAGYPTDAAAVLLIESAGFEDEMNLHENEIRRVMKENSATTWRAAKSQAERDALWAGRKGALGATGRLAPNYYIQDVVVPRTKLPQALQAVEDACAPQGIIAGNVFHAGDGNLHPLLLYDRGDPKQVAAVIEAGNEILKAAVDLGGTISGEHGIGYEKRDTLRRIFSTDDLATMSRVREVFDPRRNLNPEKIFPAGVGCAEVA